VTLAELRAWVRRQTLVTTGELSDANLTIILGQGLIDVASRYQWPWAYATDTIDLADGTSSYALPDDMMELDDLVYSGEGPGARLARTSLQAVKAEYGDLVGDSDLPDRYYLTAGDEIVFVPTPDAIKTVNVFYYATPDLDAFDADGDSPPFHSAFHLALAEFATSFVWDSLEQEEKGGYYLQRYIDTVGRMAAFYDVRLPSQPFVVGAGSGRDRQRHLDLYLGV
jgi:hypothetical protein